MIKEAIVKIVNKEDLTYDEAYAVMNEIMSGETTLTQNAAFLAAFSTKSAKAEVERALASGAAIIGVNNRNLKDFTVDTANSRRQVTPEAALRLRHFHARAGSRRMAAIADGAIVGSAVVKQMAQYGKEAPAHVGEFVRRMKQAL